MSSSKRPYTKPPLNFEQQADRLIGRGLIADKAELTLFLGRVNYYRFSTYLYPFRQPGSDDFYPNTLLADVCRLYDFDHALRMLIFNAIEALEIAILRARFVEFFTLRYGAFGYIEAENFRFTELDKHKKLLINITNSSKHSKEEFVNHFRNKYSDNYLPLWIVAEIASFGDIMTMIRNMHHTDKKDFARPYDITYKVMDSWILTLNYIRNCCAHHTRLWNRELAIKPLLPDQKNRPEFHTIPFQDSRIFSVLTIVQYLLNIINPYHTWDRDVLDLLSRFPKVPTHSMGFPDNWQDLPMWKR